MDTLEIIGTNIKALRREKGWSKFTLSEKSGVAPSGVAEIEDGKRNVGVKTLEAIARALDVTLPEITAIQPRKIPNAGMGRGGSHVRNFSS